MEGNQRKIKADKNELKYFLEKLMSDIKELSYNSFKNNVKAELDKQG